MLSTILKTVQDFGEEGIARESLLSRIQQSPTVKCNTFEDLNSQFSLALDAGRRYGLLSVKGSMVRLLYNSVAKEEPRNFSAHLLMLNEELDHELDVEDEVPVSTPSDDHGSPFPRQQNRTPRLRPRNLRVTIDERHLTRQMSDFEVDTGMNLRNSLASSNQRHSSKSERHFKDRWTIKQSSSWLSLEPIARSLSILVLLYLFLRWCNTC